MKQLIARLRNDGVSYDLGWRTEKGDEYFTTIGKLSLIRDYIQGYNITDISPELEALLA